MFFFSFFFKADLFLFFYFIFSYKEQTYQYRTESSQAEVIQRFFPQRIHKKITLLSAMTHQLSREIQKYFILILHKREGRGD